MRCRVQGFQREGRSRLQQGGLRRRRRIAVLRTLNLLQALLDLLRGEVPHSPLHSARPQTAYVTNGTVSNVLHPVLPQGCGEHNLVLCQAEGCLKSTQGAL